MSSIKQRFKFNVDELEISKHKKNVRFVKIENEQEKNAFE